MQICPAKYRERCHQKHQAGSHRCNKNVDSRTLNKEDKGTDMTETLNAALLIARQDYQSLITHLIYFGLKDLSIA